MRKKKEQISVVNSINKVEIHHSLLEKVLGMHTISASVTLISMVGEMTMAA